MCGCKKNANRRRSTSGVVVGRRANAANNVNAQSINPIQVNSLNALSSPVGGGNSMDEQRLKLEKIRRAQINRKLGK